MARVGLLLMLAVSAALAVPPSIRLGTYALAPASCGARETLWIRHYTAALYLPPREAPVAAVQDPTRPKALHMELRNKSFMPAEIPRKWRQTLEQQLDPGEYSRVRYAYKQLRPGDAVTLAYAPGAGVRLQVNGELVATAPSHSLVEALLRTWAEKEPVPERLRVVMAAHPCRV